MCIQAKYSKDIYKKMNEVRLSFREKQLAVFAPHDRQHWSFPIQITVLESLSSHCELDNSPLSNDYEIV